MVLYAFASILFALAMTVALTVMCMDFVRYRHAMMAALRTLSLDDLPVPNPVQSSLARPLRTVAVPVWQPLRGAA